jgi:4-amino-4-deoxy-L-arabinose transferase-like glycosyltransferase
MTKKKTKNRKQSREHPKPNFRFKKVLITIFPFVVAAIFVLIGIFSISYKSHTRDESRHLIRGVMLLETGDYRLNKHHPILANVLNAVPQLWNDKLEVPTTDQYFWRKADKDKLAGQLSEINGKRRQYVPNVLNRSRAVTIIAIALSIPLFYFLILKEAGAIPAVIFTVLYGFSPNIMAHSRLVTTDAWIVPIVFWASFVLYKYAKKPTLLRLAGFTLLSFAALITKYSAVPVAALWLLLLFVFELQRQKKTKGFIKSLKRFIKSLAKPALILVIWLILMTAAYGFNFKSLAETNHTNNDKTQSHVDNISGIIPDGVKFLEKPIQNFYLHAKLPFPEYIQGFYENVLLHDKYGHDSFLYGMYAKKGWWYYFPAAMAIKMPIPALIGIGAILGTAAVIGYRGFNDFVKSSNRKAWIKKRSKLKPHSVFIFVPIFLLLLSMKSSINLGIRHILVIFPFIYLGISLIAQNFIKKFKFAWIPIILLGAWYVGSAVWIYPHYLEYFNELIGGPKNGYKYLLDSNLTWAQDVFLVEDYIESIPEDETVYFNPIEEIEEGIIVIDVDLLMGRDVNKRDKTEWLREKHLNEGLEPIDRIAYTYMVFEIEPEVSQ